MTDPQPLSRADFEAQIRDMERYYHIHHPFHVMMNNGELTQKQIQGWVANRFYYQVSIPIKDANIMGYNGFLTTTVRAMIRAALKRGYNWVKRWG